MTRFLAVLPFLFLVGCGEPLVKGPVDAALIQVEGISMALASDDFEGAKKEAERLLTFLKAHSETPSELMPAAKTLHDSKDIEAARDAFTELSKVAVPLAEGKKAFHIIHCTMTRQGYGKWVQMGNEIDNPYFGAKMLRCGTRLQ